MEKRYLCEQACFVGGRRYEAGDYMAEGAEPNSHFTDTKTGERVKSKKKEPALANKAEAKEADGGSDALNKKIDELRAESEKQLNEFKALVGEHLAKFDKRIEELEEFIEVVKGPEEGLEIAGSGDEKTKASPEVPVKQASNKNSEK